MGYQKAANMFRSRCRGLRQLFASRRRARLIHTLFSGSVSGESAHRLRRLKIEVAYPVPGSAGEGAWRALTRKPPTREAPRNRNPGLRLGSRVEKQIELHHCIQHKKRSLEHIGSRGPTFTSQKSLNQT